MKNIIILLVACAALAGCATPYQKMGEQGGFQSRRLSQDSFSVMFLANGFTSPKQADAFALLRAAEITREIGYEYFIVFGDMNQSSLSNAQFTTPGYTYGTAWHTGSFTTFSATTTPATTYNVPIYKPGRELIVRCYNHFPTQSERLTGVDYKGTNRGTVFKASEIIAYVRADFKLKG
jgi:hypothetical protein